MKKIVTLSLVALSFATTLYGDEHKNSAQIMRDAFAKMEALVNQKASESVVSGSSITIETNSSVTEKEPIAKSTTDSFTLGKYGTFKFEKVNDNVYVMHGPVVGPNQENQGFMNNPALIEAEHGLIVIDPGGNYNVGKKILVEIEKVSNKPIIAVINTHKHGDHWFANKAIVEKYPQVDIFAHPHMIKVSKEGEAEVWYGILNRATKGNLEGTKAFAFPTKELKNGEEVEIDGQKFVVGHPAVGHTDTDLIIKHVNSKTLFLGDNLMKGRLGSFDESSSIFGNIELLEQIKKDTNCTLYVPGHGVSGKKDETINPFLNYLKLLVEEGQKAYDDDKESYEIKDEVLKKLEWMKDWDAFEKNTAAHLNKTMLEMGERELQAEDEEDEE
jgi:glyoxylase-like metal-dependent hydrolase (beta-lactamase superfamily II)